MDARQDYFQYLPDETIADIFAHMRLSMHVMFPIISLARSNAITFFSDYFVTRGFIGL